MLLYLPMSICKITHIHPNIQIPNPVTIHSGVFNHDSNFSSLHNIEIAAADRENATLKYYPLSISAFNTTNFFCNLSISYFGSVLQFFNSSYKSKRVFHNILCIEMSS